MHSAYELGLREFERMRACSEGKGSKAAFDDLRVQKGRGRLSAWLPKRSSTGSVRRATLMCFDFKPSGTARV